jgi:hypothetical protein
VNLATYQITDTMAGMLEPSDQYTYLGKDWLEHAEGQMTEQMDTLSPSEIKQALKRNHETPV